MSDPVPDSLLRDVLDRLGPGAVPVTRDGLADLYRAWCRHVPFDNLRKRIALADAAGRPPLAPLPGMIAEDFLAHWMDHGTGGTCWPNSNAFCELLRACGFDARRATASMMDRGVPNHGTVVVHLDDRRWLVDTSMLYEIPLPLPDEDDVDAGPVVRDDPLHPVTITAERTGDGRPASLLVQFSRGTSHETMPCRLLEFDVAPAVFAERYERSREGSIFNDRLLVRRNRESSVLNAHAGRRIEKHPHGRVDERQPDPAGWRDLLTVELGISDAILDATPPDAPDAPGAAS